MSVPSALIKNKYYGAFDKEKLPNRKQIASVQQLAPVAPTIGQTWKQFINLLFKA